MTPEELRRNEAGRWLEQARRDLNAAAILAGPEASRSVFHSQQAAEKAEKALLTFCDIPFGKTHDLAELGLRCADVFGELRQLFETASELTSYAVVFRYLDAPREPDEEEALSALSTAREVYAAVLEAVASRPEGRV